MESASKSRLPGGVDFLLLVRAFAGLAVVVDHVFTIIVPSTLYDGLFRVAGADFSWLFVGPGQTGVCVFFCLSGYLMGKGFAQRRYALSLAGALAFYRRRFLRIVPLFAVYVLVAMTIAGMSAPTWQETYRTASLVLLMQFDQRWATSYFPWFGHLWSIGTEFRFYLLVPFAAFVFARFVRSRQSALWTIAALCVFGLVWRCAAWSAIGYPATPWPAAFLAWCDTIRTPFIANLDFFFCGMLLTSVVREPFVAVSRWRLVQFFSVGALLWFGSALITQRGVFLFTSVPMTSAWAVVLPTLTLLVTLWLIVFAERLNGAPEHGLLRLPSVNVPLRAIAHCGTLTYGIYLWHLLFASHPLAFTRSGEHVLASFFGAVMLTYGFAALLAQITYLGVELPADPPLRRPLEAAA